MRHRPDIDGLRAVAIIPVVLYHLKSPFFSGGFVGVDIFFVISGYLITSLIHEEIVQQRFSIANFYERRIRRIFPALFAMIGVCTLITAAIMLPDDFEIFGKSIIAATFFVANIFFWNKTAYFDPSAEASPLLHTWSLSVEEQFYLIFPLLLMLIYRHSQGRRKSILIPVTFLSLLLSIWGMRSFSTATFYLFPTRAWELLFGSLLALNLFPAIRSQRQRECCAACGLILICWAVFHFSPTTPFPGANALFPCFGALLIISAGKDGSSMVGRLLGLRPVVFVGLISYSLYLWHWPVLVFARQIFYQQRSVWHLPPILIISLFMAILSWKYIEQPFRTKQNFHQKKIFSLATGVMLFFLVTGSAIDIGQGFPARFGGNLVSLTFDLQEYGLGTCFLDEHQHYSQWREESCFVTRKHSSNTLLWGDSFAAHYLPGVKQNSDKIRSNIILYSAGGCAPVFTYDPVYRKQCHQFAAQVPSLIQRLDISSVILAADWDLAFHNGLTFDALQDTIAQLEKDGTQVFLIGQGPRFSRSVQDIANLARITGQSTNSSVASIDFQTINTRLKAMIPFQHFVDPSTPFCQGQSCQFADKENFWFWDNGHLTIAGSKKSAEYILSAFNL